MLCGEIGEIALKKMITGKSNKIKRHICAIMTGVIALTTVGSVLHFNEKSVQAKETLYGIEKVLSDLEANKTSYDILEIVPDDVTGIVSVNDVSGNTVSINVVQKMGFLGYYVGGSEPLRDDVNTIVNGVVTVSGNEGWIDTTLNESSLRYGAVKKITDKVKASDIYDETNGPFVLSESYAEVRNGEDFSKLNWINSEEYFERLKADKKLLPIVRNLPDSDLPDKYYVDTAKGFMDPAGYSSEYANYIGWFIGADDDTNVASVFVNSYLSENKADPDVKEYEDENFILAERADDRIGSFDPNLRLPEIPDSSAEPTVSADIVAVFDAASDEDGNRLDVKAGYFVADYVALSDLTEAIPGETPVYAWNDTKEVFVYAGTYTDVTTTSNSGGENDNGDENDNGENSDENSDENNGVEDNNDENNNEGSSIVENIDQSSTGYNRTIEKVVVEPAYSSATPVNTGDDISQDSGGNAEDISETERVPVKEENLKGDSEVSYGTESDPPVGNETEAESETETIDGDIVNIDITGEEEDSVGRDSAVTEEYYIVTFEYAEIDDNDSAAKNSDLGMYQVLGFVAADENSGAQYVLASVNDPYGVIVPNLTGNGLISVKEDCDQFDFLYEYAKGEGNFSWHGDETNGKPYRINGDTIYYRFDIENREWFKRFVFDRDCYPYDQVAASDDTAKKLSIKVVSKKASDVTENDIADKEKDEYKYRLIALMAGDDAYCISGENTGDKGYVDYSAGSEYDISQYVYTQIINRVAKYNTPIIADYKIIENENNREIDDMARDSLAYNLASVLMLEDISGYNVLIYGMEHDFESGAIAGTRYSPFDYAANNGINFIANNYNHFVNKHIYLYNRKNNTGSGTHLNPANTTFDNRFTDSDEINAGFSEVVKDIENEKMFREADFSLKDKPLKHDWVSEATAIRYIIGCSYARSTEGKDELKVLEIDPVNWVVCHDLEADNSDIKNNADFLAKHPKDSESYNKLLSVNENGEQVIYAGELYYMDAAGKKKSLLKQEGLHINITYMTTAEYIGHIEDINAEYDLVYIGMNTGATSTKGNYVVDKEGGYAVTTAWRSATRDEFLSYFRNLGQTGRDWPNWKAYYRLDRDNKRYEGWAYYNVGGDLYNPSRAVRYELQISELKPQIGHYNNYGGYRHRLSNQDDVNNGRATEVDKIITDFNDNNMDGLVYSNVGDLSYISDTAGGALKLRTGGTDAEPEYTWLETIDGKQDGYGKAYDYMSINYSSDLGYSSGGANNYSLYRTRYNGNDITKEKVEALKDFARAGYPIILADDFYASYNPETRKGTINECTVDNSSYMYDATKWLIDEFSDKNVFKLSYTPTNVFDWYVLKLGKPTIEMTDERSKSSQTSTVYLGEADKSGDGHYYAYYRFKINSRGSSEANAKFSVGLYIDINADGKFSPTNEGIMFSDIKDYDTFTTVSKIDTDENGMPVYELTPGHEYEARCKLSGSFVGCLPWRLNVYQIGNKYRRTNANGYYAVRNTEKHVKILQLMQADNANNWDMEADYSTNNSLFHRLITDTEYVPFTVDITSMTRSELENLSAINPKTSEGFYEYFKNYHMLVLGYNDIYDSLTGDMGEEIAKGIKKYIDEGYSVLFTHDCTSFYNNKHHQSKTSGGTTIEMLGTFWGYQFNTVVRNIVGMDRYDVMKESKHENEKPYKPRSNRQIVLDFEAHGFTYHIINHWGYQSSKSIATDNQWTQYMMYRDSDSGNWWEAISDANTRDSQSRNARFNKSLGYSNFYNASLGGGQYSQTTRVKQINKGQITQYPYLLDEDFPVVQTHSQYYQLDMTADDDHDGESDIVVWYCISDIDGVDVNSYNVSPNDVRNTYYIYNKGNVTYSGVGHRQVTGEEEMRLFINTMVAAYRTGLHAPDLTIVDSYNANAKKIRNLYVSYDDQIQKMVSANSLDPDLAGLNKNSDIDNYVELYFNADQVSLVQNASAIDHHLYAKVFYEDDTSDESLEYKEDTTNGDYYYDSASGKYIKGEYVRRTSQPSQFREARNGERPTHAKVGDNDYRECDYLKIRDFEEGVVDTGKTKVTALTLTSTPDVDGSITTEDGNAVRIMDATLVDSTFARDNFTNDSEYAKFEVLKDHIIGCAQIQNGVTYKVRIPVTDDDMWGGIDKYGSNLKNTKAVYVIVMDFASYRNNQGSSDGTGEENNTSEESSESSTGDTKGKIYKIEMTKWRADKADIARVEVFNLD